MKKLKSVNPATQKVIGETPISMSKDVTLAVSKAKKTFPLWKKTSVKERVAYVKKLQKLLVKHQKELAALTTAEMGKPLQQAFDDVTAELEFIDWYIENAATAFAETVIKETKKATYKILYEPWGVCASIAPWNFPISMASSGITQQLLAGNTVIFKPSEFTTLTQKRFIDIFNGTGLPEGVLQGLYGYGEVGKLLVDSPVDLVWFTGSTTVGQEIFAKCGKKFIRGLMELGGSSPAIVFADSDIEHTVEQLYWGRYLNCGQTCTAIKRLFIEKPIFNEVIERLRVRLEKATVGDPTKQVDFGPLVSREQLDTLISQVEDAKKKGAQVVIGGGQSKDPSLRQGNYYLPTILTRVSKNMRVYHEEVFGPVLSVFPFTDEQEVIQEANNTPYGLSAEIYTKDSKKAERLAHDLESGTIAVNTDSFYVPFCPIGGYKKSGMGREYGIEGFREYTQIKYICIAK
ncbi:aldehyde dehydrogenase [Candidatus Gottesmanbacteria bacterium]|nr:aldehyde dehydrogenase [Candidatus Gottesmanbacteria bacterium]